MKSKYFIALMSLLPLSVVADTGMEQRVAALEEAATDFQESSDYLSNGLIFTDGYLVAYKSDKYEEYIGPIFKDHLRSPHYYLEYDLHGTIGYIFISSGRRMGFYTSKVVSSKSDCSDSYLDINGWAILPTKENFFVAYNINDNYEYMYNIYQIDMSSPIELETAYYKVRNSDKQSMKCVEGSLSPNAYPIVDSKEYGTSSSFYTTAVDDLP